jgi:hypothetical protein
VAHEDYFALAADEARKATCGRAKCGSVIISVKGEVIGRGWNGPPAELASQRRCERRGELSETFKSDRTCCVHAEWRAIIDALRLYPVEVKGATLYFTRVNEVGEMIFSGEPYCTICSKLALEVGLSGFALWHESGIKIYDTVDYNDRSFSA